jgi:WS/DGAT/MGAT family acyltransferase
MATQRAQARDANDTPSAIKQPPAKAPKPARARPAASSLPKPFTRRMTRVDTAWLRMDSDANLMVIVGVWLIKPRIKIEDARERIAASLSQYPRFLQRVEEDAVGANWVEHQAFDIAEHVVADTLVRAPGQSPTDALKAHVGELAITPLDRSRPLWQFHVVEDLGDGRSALIARVHHCIGDGIALISVMLSMVDGGKGPPPRKAKAPVDDAAEDEADWFTDALLKPMTDLTVKAIGLTGDGMSKGMAKGMAIGADLMANPMGMGGSLDAARMGAQVVSDLGAFALMSDDSPTRLKGRATRGKRVAWGEPLPLDAVKVVGKAMGVSINDVLLSCVAGAIGAYLRDQGDDTTGQEIRAMVPVNLRPMDKAYKLGNRFGLVPLVLPIGIEHPIKRLYAVNARMTQLKGSYQPLLAFAVLAVAGLMIKPVQDAMLGLFAKKATAVMTNVPGPGTALTFCGSKVEQVMFWVPQSGDIGMGVSILSYAGGVQFGLITDHQLCPDPEAIIERFAPEFDKLLMLALMGPWEGAGSSPVA